MNRTHFVVYLVVGIAMPVLPVTSITGWAWAHLWVGLVASAVYFASLGLEGAANLSAAILLAERGVLGIAESLIIIGALGWALALVPAALRGQRGGI